MKTLMTTMSLSSTLVLILLSLQSISSLEAHKGGFSVEIIHRDSSKSPLYRPTETQFQRVANAVGRSINRANRFNQNTPRTNITQDDGGYLLSYSVGTPPFQVYGIADTGSPMIWLQCKPCKPCYNQTSPIFEPSKSSTYRNVSYSSRICKLVEGTTRDGDNCEYHAAYGDGSESHGDLSEEILTLDSTNGSSIQFPRTVIGCGRMNTGPYDRNSSGIVGLGRGPVSLISQLGSSIGGKFSYCFAPTSNTSSRLNFGDAAVVSGKGTVSTPIISRGEVFYYLTLEAFSVGNKRINLESSSSESDGEGNIIIDSGTTLTFVPDDVYSKLESAVAHEVKLKRVKGPYKQLSLCFESSFHDLKAPVITAHFRGADVKLNAVNTFIEVAERVVCFAFSSSKGAVFGNVAQVNLLVGYDLEKKRVSFKPTDCTNQ
ncbi:aspartic proteinase CDR1 [Vigna radiata var. radiata]|uniref:Aspartic proteinase CDR1 n=1 Tax=Vigna radiata var. radiata TaxID=3916 RepID=A0A3Q0F5H6_VIGRR|nr:aspartic proteinase CDR1 [Vigna radiata var. radiata]